MFRVFSSVLEFWAVMMSIGDLVSERCAQLPSWLKYFLGVHTSVPNTSWTRPISLLVPGTPRPSCGQFGPTPNHGPTWRPCHFQIQGGLVNAQKICWTQKTSYQCRSMPWSKSEMYPICSHHECAHFWPFSAIFHIFGPTCTMFSPPLHAGGSSVWNVHCMLLMHIGCRHSQTTCADRCTPSRGVA